MKKKKKRKYKPYYYRAIPVKLYLTQKKQRKVKALILAYRKAVRFYLNYIFNHKDECGLNKNLLSKLENSKLSERYKSQALKQAIGIWEGCEDKAKQPPKFNGHPNLDAKFISIQSNYTSKKFDLWIKFSNLAKGKVIYLPSKKHKRLKYWMERGTLVQGCELHENKVVVWVKIIKTPYKQEGDAIGVDLGMNKLITTSEYQKLGEDFSKLNDKILNKEQGSKSYKKLLKTRDIFINTLVKQLPWDKVNVLCYELLKNLTKGKKGRRSKKSFRKRQQHWCYRKVISRIMQLAQENRVRLVYVYPQYTSQQCPSCRNVDEFNRTDEKFKCLACGYEHDADVVGANNILKRGLDWLSSLESLNKKT